LISNNESKILEFENLRDINLKYVEEEILQNRLRKQEFKKLQEVLDSKVN